MKRIHPSLLALFVLGGCFVGELDIGNKSCPCADGFRCDTDRDVCVRELPDAATNGLDAGPNGVDASRSDASGTDAASGIDSGGTPLDETSCDDVHQSAIFCDGFESGAPMVEWDGVSTELGGIARWTDTMPYRGVGSFESRTSQPSARGYLEKVGLGAHTSGTIHVRTYIYLSSATRITHGTIMLFAQGVSPWHGVALEILDTGEPVLFIESLDLDVFTPARLSLPFDRWFCAELEVGIDAAGHVALSVDGAEVVRRTGLNTVVSPGYDILNIGVSWSESTNNEALVFLDEVVVASSPIGCD